MFTQRTIEPFLTVRLGGLNAKFAMEIVLSDTEGVGVWGWSVHAVIGWEVVGRAMVLVGVGVGAAGCPCADCGCEHPLITRKSTMQVRRTITFFIH